MGFNKRFVAKEVILESLKNGEPLSKLFSADSLIFMDKFSSIVYNKHKEGVEDKNIKKLIENAQLR